MTNNISRIEERAHQSTPWLEAQAIAIGGVCFHEMIMMVASKNNIMRIIKAGKK
jgi:hypothetical protein